MNFAMSRNTNAVKVTKEREKKPYKRLAQCIGSGEPSKNIRFAMAQQVSKLKAESLLAMPFVELETELCVSG